MKKTAAHCLLVALAASPVRAQTQQAFNSTGNAFYSLCTPQNVNYPSCVYYLIGYSDGLELVNALLERNGKSPMFCWPSAGKATLSSVTGVQSVDIVMGYLQRNPQRRHELIVGLIIEAYKEAFPCR